MSVNTTPTPACAHGSLARWVLAAALSVAGSAGALAQTQATCDTGSLPPNTQLRVTQQQGRALVEVTKPNSAGRKMDIEYGDELYSLKFGADGKVRAGFALTAANNEFTIAMSETQPISCQVAVPDFKKIYRVILRWRDPVQLDLNVLEPGGRVGEVGHVNGLRPNSNMTQGIGQMDVVGVAPAEGATAEMSYVVANPSTMPANSVFTYRLDYVTRGLQPEAPYCDDFALAAPQFEFITIENGNVTTRKMSVNHARCREKLADSRRLMPIRQ